MRAHKLNNNERVKLNNIIYYCIVKTIHIEVLWCASTAYSLHYHTHDRYLNILYIFDKYIQIYTTRGYVDIIIFNLCITVLASHIYRV